MSVVEFTVFSKIVSFLNAKGINIVKVDSSRPWGGFIVVDDNHLTLFIDTFFKNANMDRLKTGAKLSPKILIVAPGKRLSWQYHHRREEIWKVVEGPIGVVRSDTDEEHPCVSCATNTVIEFSKGERHRLVGLHTTGVVAEIWQHTDATNPSDEMDIVRLQDDYGRR